MPSLHICASYTTQLTNPRDQNLPLPGGAKTYTGDLTYYGTGLGACGVTSTDNDLIVSISHFVFDAMQSGSDPNKNPLCGKKLRAQRDNNGKTVSVDLTVVDRCACAILLFARPYANIVKGTGCQPNDIDVSPAVFKKLADMDLGRVSVTWAWL